MKVKFSESYSSQTTLINPRYLGELVIEAINKRFDKVSIFESVLRGTNVEMHLKYANGKAVSEDTLIKIVEYLKDELPLLELNGVEISIYEWYNKRLILDISG